VKKEKKMKQHSIQLFACFVFGALILAVLPISLVNGELQKSPNHIYICTFNVYKLGSVATKYTSLDEEADPDSSPSTFSTPQRIKNLANVLAEGPFDLVVFQEVTDGERGRAAMTDLVKELKDQHSLDYTFFMSDYIGQGLMAEAIAFMYDPKVAKPELLPGQTSMVQNIEIPGRDLVRTQWEAGDFDFTLISAHLAWSNEAHRDAGYAKVNDIFWTDTPSQFSDDPDIIVLGDFNRFGDDYDSVKELNYNSSRFIAPNVTFFDPQFSNTKSVTKPSILDKGVPNNDEQLISTTVAKNSKVYDMILLSKDVDEEFPPGTAQAAYGTDFGIVHFDEPTGFGYQSGADALSHYNLKIAYSDHRPLWMRFKTNTGDNDDGPGGIEVTTPVDIPQYVATQHGKRFHRPNCRYVKGRQISKTWTDRDAAATELLPCGTCKP
jgi:endonuclease/exonuclease/phosphatase family metal-dependent hydrolase